MKRTGLIITAAVALLAVAGVLRSKPLAPPTGLNIVVVIDREISAEKMILVKQGMRALLAALGPDDRLGLIGVGEDLLTQSGSDEVPRGREMLTRWIEGLESAPTTVQIGLGTPMTMADGLLDMTRSGTRAPRIVLVSDGVHVAGTFDTDKGLRNQVMELYRRGVRIDAISPGLPEARPPLEALAELGGGRLVVMRVASDVTSLLPVRR